MTQWKKPLIALLAVVNLALLGALVHANMPTAEAQSSRTPLYASTNYVMTTGMYDTDREAVYLIDLSTGRMVGLRWNPNTKEVEPVGSRDFTKDIR